jgi:hypothetical protein
MAVIMATFLPPVVTWRTNFQDFEVLKYLKRWFLTSLENDI